MEISDIISATFEDGEKLISVHLDTNIESHPPFFKSVPNDMGNADRRILAKWEELGNTIAPKPLPSRADYRKSALARVDEEHSNYLVMLTGGATVAERDTWKTKEEAAIAYLGALASEGQTAMLSAEAAGSDIDVTVLAESIVAKARDFQKFIGLAASLRAQGRAAILAATADEVPQDRIQTSIDAVFDQLSRTVVETMAELAKA